MARSNRTVQLVPLECGTCARAGLDDCASPEEHMRPITVPVQPCGHLPGDVCGCEPLAVGSALYGGRPSS